MNGTEYIHVGQQLKTIQFQDFFGNQSVTYKKIRIGNTLETRELTYSYTFSNSPKNALIDYKGTVLF